MSSNDDLNQRITTAIEAQLLALMPPEDIRKKVDATIDRFFERAQRYDRWEPSPFRPAGV